MAAKIIAGPNNRLYVNNPLDWNRSAGTDFLWVPSTGTDLITGGTAGSLLSAAGWVETSGAYATPSAADFMSSTDTGVHNGIGNNATGDILRSPIIFGDYAHAIQASYILGYVPTRLSVEVHGSFTVASADEGQSAFGLLEDGGTASVAADQMAAIGSDGTNFRLRNGALTGWTGAVTGPLIDNAAHLWRIDFYGTTTQFFVDGVSYGTLTTELDEWPCSFFMHSLTTNRMFLSSIHIFYR